MPWATARRSTTPPHLDTGARSSIQQMEKDIANATLLVHQILDAGLRVICDASKSVMGCVLQQLIDGQWKTLGLFSRKFNDTQKKYSTYDREFFEYMIEGRPLIIFTYHEPLTHAFKQENEKASPRQRRNLSYISKFSTNIRHIPGPNSNAANVLSRVNAIFLSSLIDLNELSIKQ